MASLEAATPNGLVPVYGIETAIYTIPNTSTALLYVSKVDTTGLLTTSAPSRILTTALLKYYLLYPPHAVHSFRIHVFARAQDQYLFPGSIENKSKRVLDDKGLCKWWKTVLSEATYTLNTSERQHRDLQLFYLLGGYSYLESLPLLPAAYPPDSKCGPEWVYGHPYATIAGPLPASKEAVTLNDLIPAFPDDPKSRYLTSLTSSPIPAAGDEGDYDDVIERLRKFSDSNSAILAMRTNDIEKQRIQERARIIGNNIDEYWECMGARQECCSGHVAGFFVVSSEMSRENDVVAVGSSPTHNAPQPAPASLSHSNYVRLWSSVHNVDYASFNKSTDAYEHWISDLQQAVVRGVASEQDWNDEAAGSVTVSNTAILNEPNLLKRVLPLKPVTSLQVKKKTKIVTE